MEQQQAQLDKETAKIEAKRRANEERTKRFLNARQRTLGVDVQALDAQVAEKRRNQQNSDDSDRLERIRAKEIDRILEAAAAEEVNMRKFQMEELKKEWTTKSGDIKEKRAFIDPDYEPEKFGPSSFQVFDGEDTLAEERERLKKDQVRRWAQEQAAEHAVQKQRERDEDLYNAEMIRQIDQIRGQAAEQEKQMHSMLLREVSHTNRELAEMQANRKMMDKMRQTCDDDGGSLVTSIPLSISAPSLDSDGKVVRKDAFRGYTPAQCRKLLADNEILRDIKRQQQEDERAMEAEWARAQQQQIRAMELANYEEQQLKKYQQEAVYHNLREQVQTRAKQKYDYDEERKTDISATFFNNFGKSCR
jgi:hypothetical protein